MNEHNPQKIEYIEYKSNDKTFYHKQIIHDFLRYEISKGNLPCINEECRWSEQRLDEYLLIEFPYYRHNRLMCIQNHFFHELYNNEIFETIFERAKETYGKLYDIIFRELDNKGKLYNTINTYGPNMYNRFKNEFLQQLKVDYDYISSLYKINTISINEVNILCGDKECTDLLYILDEKTVYKCLTDTNNFLFVSVDRSTSKGVSYNYHAVCYSKEDLEKAIKMYTKINYNCIYGQDTIYIQLPIGPSGIYVYIPLFSAMILLQSDKLIFYLLKHDVTKYVSSSEEYQYCDKDKDKTTHILHIVHCGGFNCAPKGWTGFQNKKRKSGESSEESSEEKSEKTSEKTNYKKVKTKNV